MNKKRVLHSIAFMLAAGLALIASAPAMAAPCATAPASLACPAYSACLQWTAPTTRESGAALAPNEIKGYAISLDGVLVASPTTTSYTHTVSLDKTLSTTSIWSIATVDTDNNKSTTPTSCTQPVVVVGPKSNPAAPGAVTITAR